jgi:hypothetical protein
MPLEGRMIRRSLKLLLVALVASFALTSSLEAAPRKTVRHRAKHSTRVSASPNASTATHKPAARARKHTTTTHKKTTRKHTSTKPR